MSNVNVKGNGQIMIPLPTKLDLQADRADEILQMEQVLHDCAKELHVLEWKANRIEQARKAS